MEPKQQEGREFYWTEKLIITLGNRESISFDNCAYCLYPNGIFEVRLREVRKTDKNETVTQNVSYLYKHADILSMKMIETVSVTKVESETDNVVQLRTEDK